jgi:ATP-dependent helicase/nuclease subunit A
MQSQTLELKSTNIVRAGAGAGKTRNLTLRVLDWVESFIASEARFPKLVVTTFTVKATQELRERLLLFATERENEELLEYVRSGSYLQISTIHGVLSSLLRKYAYAIGIDSGFEVLSGIDNRKIGLSMLRNKLIAKPSYQTLLQTYNFNELINYFEHYYSAYLYRMDLKPVDRSTIENYLGRELQKQFNRAQELAKEIQSDIAANEGAGASLENWQLLANELSSFNLRETVELNLEQIESSVARVGRFPTNPAKRPVVYSETKDSVKSFWDEFKKLVDWRNELLPFLDDYESNNKLFHNLAQDLFEDYLDEKRSQSKISMADIELLSSYLLREKPELAYAFSEEYDYWLIDEFQDTSPDQLEILRKLIDDRPYYVVGDPQQSIYYFRGADQSLFLKEEAYIEEKGGNKFLLMKNYRTKPSTMEFINDYMEQFGFARMETRNPEELDSKNLSAEFLILEDRECETRAIANRVVGLLNDGVSPSEICILARTKKTLEEVGDVLREKQVPHYIHTSGSFFERREVLDLLFVLKFLVHPFDNKNLIGLLRSPWFYLADEVIYKYSDYKSYLWDNLLENHKQGPIQVLSDLKDYADEYGVLSALEKVLVESGMLELSRKYDPSGKREANIWKLITDLREEEHKSFFNPLSVLRKAEDLASVSNEGETEAAAALEPNRVQLMSIHASKGLEFSYVFLAHMNKKANLTNSLSFYLGEEGEFSLPTAIDEDGKKRLPPLVSEKLEEIKKREREESFRLLYVALTRAEEKLYLSWSEDPKKDSWIEGLSWDISEGLHESEHYSYLVSHEVEECKYEGEEAFAPKLKDAFRDSLISMYQPVETESVSRLLEQRTEYGRQAKKGEDNLFYSPEHFHEKMNKAAKGTYLHALLEKYVASRKLDIELELETSAQKYIDYLISESAYPFEELMDRAQLEWGFVLRWKGKTIEGQVDFWSEDDQGNIWVMDYKTGSSRYQSKAMEQLQIYGLALHKMFPQKPIKLAAIFVEEEKSYVADFSMDQIESLFS